MEDLIKIPKIQMILFFKFSKFDQGMRTYICNAHQLGDYLQKVQFYLNKIDTCLLGPYIFLYDYAWACAYLFTHFCLSENTLIANCHPII